VRFSAAEVLAASEVDQDRVAAALPRVDPSRIPVWAAARFFRLFWPKGISAVAMPWGIYIHPERLAEGAHTLGLLIVHEVTHIEQWRRLGPWGWARSYLGDYWRGRRAGLGHHPAYREIGLEVEARDVSARICG